VVATLALYGGSIAVVGVGTSGATTPSAAPAVVAAASQNDAFINHVYQDLLGRPADPAGLDYWSSVLSSGVPRASVVWALVTSDEHRTNVINAMYQRFLGRPPDAAGVAYWIGKFAAGMTYEEAQAHLVGSDEYYATRGGSDPATFLTTMYHDIYGQNIDPDTLARNVAVFQQNPRSGFALGSLEGAAYAARTADAYYQQFLGRAADPDGRLYWSSLLHFPTHHAEEFVITSFLDSGEYWNRATA
jgi:hypothetical protein